MSGAISVLIVVVAVLQRTGLLAKGLDLLKNRLKRPPAQADLLAGPSLGGAFPTPEVEGLARPDLLSALKRHEQEQTRLDEERDLIVQFLTRNNVPKEGK